MLPSLTRLISGVLLMRLLGIGLQLGWFMLLVRLLPIEQVGLYSAINAGWVLMRALGAFGSEQAMLRRLPVLYREGRMRTARRWQAIALRYSLLRLAGALAGAAMLAALGERLGWWQISPALWLALPLGALCYSLNGLQTYLLLAAEKPYAANLADNLLLPLALSALSAALYATGDVSLERVLLIQAGLSASVCAVYGLLCHRTYRGAADNEAAEITAEEQRQFRSQSLTLLGTGGLIQLNIRLPVLLAPFVIGATGTALLEVAMRFANLLGLVQYAASQVTAPRISAYCHQRRQEALQTLLIQSCWLALLPTLALAGVLAFAGPWLIPTLTQPAYAAAYLPMLLLTIGFTVNTASGPAQHVLTLSGHAADALRMSAMESVIVLAAALALGLYWGEEGMALSITLAMIARNVVLNRLLSARLSLRPGVWSRQSACEWLAMLRRGPA